MTSAPFPRSLFIHLLDIRVAWPILASSELHPGNCWVFLVFPVSSSPPAHLVPHQQAMRKFISIKVLVSLSCPIYLELVTGAWCCHCRTCRRSPGRHGIILESSIHSGIHPVLYAHQHKSQTSQSDENSFESSLLESSPACTLLLSISPAQGKCVEEDVTFQF